MEAVATRKILSCPVTALNYLYRFLLSGDHKLAVLVNVNIAKTSLECTVYYVLLCEDEWQNVFVHSCA